MFGFTTKKAYNELYKELEDIQQQLLDALDKAPETIEIEVPCTCKEDLKELVKDKAALSKELTDLEKQRLDAVKKLKETQQDHKIAVEDIKHMQKLLNEKNALELDRKVFEAEKKANTDIEKIRKEYASKLEKELLDERKKMQDFMQRVMDALPNVNVKMGGKIGG